MSDRIARSEGPGAGVDQALPDRANTLAGAFDACPHPLIVSRATDSRIVEANRAMMSTTGYRRDQLVGRTPLEVGLFQNPADREVVYEALTTRGSIVNLPLRLLAADGRPAECLFSASVFRHGDEAFIVTLVDDVHELRDTERALAISEQRLKLALEASSTALWEWKLPDDADFAIAHYESMLGYPEGSLGPGLNQLRALIHPDDVDAAIRGLRAHLKGSVAAWSEQFRVITHAGSWIWVHASGRIVESAPDGTPTRLAGTLRDVTDRRRVEDALRLEGDRFRSLVHNSFDVVFVLAADGTIKYATPSVSRVLGYEPDALVGTNAFSYIHADDRAEIIRELRDEVMTKTNTGVATAFRALKPDGTDLHMEGLATSMLDNPAIEGIVVVVRDTTERRKMEARVLQAQKLESLGVLAGGVAHDFNNLLTSVLGNASFAARSLPEDSPARELLDRVQVAARRAAELTRQLLAYAGRRTVQGQSVHVADLADEMAELMRVSVGRNCVLVLDLPRNLPAVCADATQLPQVVMNLILNAAESYGDSGGEVRVHAGVRDCDETWLRSCYFAAENAVAGRYVFIEVSDDGSGMTPEMVTRIFDPFYTTKFTGRGLGLSSVLGIMRSHGGAIGVRTAPGRGSMFTILLPAEEDVAVEPPAESRRFSSIPAEQQGTVLVVDDEAAIREVCAAGLEAAGFRVLCAADGESGIAAFRAAGEDLRLVLLDLTMPNTDGSVVLARIRAEAPRLRVILTSGHAEQYVMSRIANLGGARFLQKPFSLDELLLAVEESLR